MLFYSYLFVLCFLPCCLLCNYAFRKLRQPRLAIWSLIAFSLLYYGWWNPSFLWILTGSIVVNYLLSRALFAVRDVQPKLARSILIAGVIGNLAVLARYKYWCLLDGPLACRSVALPLAISFFTFQQIEFLLDTANGKVGAQKFSTYSLFVTFFPHLIAGPITRHSELMPQFERPSHSGAANFSIGVTIFVIGLCKKVFLADRLAILAAPSFLSAANGDHVSFALAWLGAASFTLQLYFDFSGYSDMAIGISRMLGIKLPLNFNSPFKAVNIVDFWQRWHLTLTRYVNAHLYNPIVANLARRSTGKPDSFRNVMIVMAAPTAIIMTIVGIWHGAGAQFAVFGLMHGVLLAGYQTFRWGTRHWPTLETVRRYLPRWLCVAATFGLVVISFVFFKASSIGAALSILTGMSGVVWTPIISDNIDHLDWLTRLTLTLGREDLRNFVVQLQHGYWELLIVPTSLMIIWFAPNTQQILATYLNDGAELSRAENCPPVQYSIQPLKGRLWSLGLTSWRPSVTMAILTVFLLILALQKANYYGTAFLYFRF